MIRIMKYFLEKYCLSAGLKADKDRPSWWLDTMAVCGQCTLVHQGRHRQHEGRGHINWDITHTKVKIVRPSRFILDEMENVFKILNIHYFPRFRVTNTRRVE